MEKKFWLNSSTLQGSLLGILPALYIVFKTFGIELPAGVLEKLVEGLMAVSTIASVFLTFTGRLSAKHEITFKKDEASV